MSDPRERTPFRVAQKWAFEIDLPQVRKEFTIYEVEEHPELGIYCSLEVKLDPPFRFSQCSQQSALNVLMSAKALEESVTGLIEERAALPRWLTGSKGEFSITPEQWQERRWHQDLDSRPLQEILKEKFASLERSRAEEQLRQSQPPREPSHGIWSLIAHGNAVELQSLLQQHPGLANEPLPHDPEDGYCSYEGLVDEAEWYPLDAVAEYGTEEIARLFLEFGADVNKANSDGDTPLHFAARSNNCYTGEIGRLYLERGANPNARNKEGKAPIRVAYCMHGLAEALIEHGAELDLSYALALRRVDWLRDQFASNPQETIASAIHPRYLVDHFVDYLANTAEEFSKNRDILTLLLDNDCDPNGVSALFYAVQRRYTELAEYLIQRGANPNRYLDQSETYLTDIASDQQMIEMLKLYGTKMNPYEREKDAWET
jgi:ankyrin repeat protein